MSGLKVIGRNNLFYTRYCPVNVPPPIGNRYLGKKLNPIHPKLSHMYRHADRNTLWWSVSELDMLDEKKVVRSWCCRRVRIAFRESLKKRGFDEKGRKIVLDALGKPTTVVGRRGTLELVPNPKLKRESNKELQQLADEAVDLLIKAPTEMVRPPKKKRRL